jgi:hypothetical protein
MRIVIRPTVPLGLDLQYPASGLAASPAVVHSYSPASSRYSSTFATDLLAPFAVRPAFPASDYYEASAPTSAISRRRAALLPRWLHGSEGHTGRFPRSSPSRSTSEASSSTPTASPRLRRRSSPWPPGRLTHRDQEFPAPATGSGTHRDQPYPPDLSWRAVKGRQTPISRVHLLVLLTRPAPSGSADASRRCQGRSLLDQAAPSFTQPLRRPGDEGLSPPFDFRRLVAHMAFCPVNSA